jgi:periplasmic divalent cation tolerance protein
MRPTFTDSGREFRGDEMPTEFVQVQTTHDNEEAARDLIRAVVRERLAACGQLVGPLRSIYWWQSRIDEAEEWLCVFKTRADLLPRLEEFIADEHSYEVPEFIVTEIVHASSPYGGWIRDETAG